MGKTISYFGSKLDTQHVVEDKAFTQSLANDRFNPMKDFRDATSPGPGQYESNSKLHDKTNKIYLNRTTRMPAKRYETVSPGPGTYRHQDGFGMYSADDGKGNLINLIGASAGKTLGAKLKNSPYKSVNKLKQPSRFLTRVIEEEE